MIFIIKKYFCRLLVITWILIIWNFYQLFPNFDVNNISKVPLSGIKNDCDQFEVIKKFLHRNENLLVWGLGNECVSHLNGIPGKVVFIETDETSYEANVKMMKRKYPHLTVHVVHYTTNTEKVLSPKQLAKLDISAQLPNSVLHERWHVIVINTPLSFYNNGRFNAIYTSKILSKEYTHVFVNDHEEGAITLQILGKPDDIIYYSDSSSGTAKAQAQFILHSKKINVVESVTKNRYIVNNFSPQGISKSLVDWTIMLSVNNGFYDFFQNWWWYFTQLDLKALVIVISEDNIAFEKLTKLNLDNVIVERSDLLSINASVDYRTYLYNKMVSARPFYLLKYLKKGVNVIYCDVDNIWLQNPLPYFTGNFDIWSQLDFPKLYCTGLLAINSNNKTIQLMQSWGETLNKRLGVNQGIFNQLVKRSTIRIKALESAVFPSGKQYFKEFSVEQRANVVAVHNNFIIGHDKKLDRFKAFNLWFNLSVAG